MLRSDHEVHGVVRSAPLSPVEDVQYHCADLAGNWSQGDLPRSIDCIVHLAQSRHFREFPERAMDVFRVNVESTAMLLDYCHRSGGARFIYASSGGVYGNGARAFTENSPLVPPVHLGHYLGSKMCGEILSQGYIQIFGVAVLRFFFVYGPGQERSMLIPRLFDNVQNGRPILLQGDAGIRINPVHVEDAAWALVAAIQSGASETFNVAGPDVLSIREIADSIGEYLGREPVFQAADGEARDLVGDNSAMSARLWAPRKVFKECIEELHPD